MKNRSRSMNSEVDHPLWSSLEVAKLLVSILTPLLLAYLGYMIANIQSDVAQTREHQKRLEEQRFQQELAERGRTRDFRLELYKEAGPLLNDIFAFHFYVGRWKEFAPTAIIEKKRKLDTTMYSHESLFTREFFAKYVAFMGEGFLTAGGWHTDSRIRASAKCRKNDSREDEAQWRARFTEEDNRTRLCVAYRDLLGILSKELLFKELPAEGLTDAQKLGSCPPLYSLASCERTR